MGNNKIIIIMIKKITEAHDLSLTFTKNIHDEIGSLGICTWAGSSRVPFHWWLQAARVFPSCPQQPEAPGVPPATAAAGIRCAARRGQKLQGPPASPGLHRQQGTLQLPASAG